MVENEVKNVKRGQRVPYSTLPSLQSVLHIQCHNQCGSYVASAFAWCVRPEFPPNRWNTMCTASRQDNHWVNATVSLLVMCFFFIFYHNVTVTVTRSDTLSSTTKASETWCQNHFRATVIANTERVGVIDIWSTLFAQILKQNVAGSILYRTDVQQYHFFF